MSVKDSVLLIKLKDGVQDTVVFLRMLEQFKIPAVMETRRKKLLEKLLHLQGDTIRETPPSYENGDATSPTKDDEKRELARSSSVVDSKVSEYARIETKAMGEMATFSTKKAAGTAPEVAKEEPANEGTDYLEPASVLKREKKKGEVGAAASERPASTASNESEVKKEETGESNGVAAAGEGKGKKKRFGGGGLKVLRNKIGKRSKKTGHNVSAVTEVEGENGEQEPAEQGEGEETTSVAGGEGEAKEEEEKEAEGATEGEGAAEKKEEEVQEEGVRITSVLEKRVPKRLGKGFNWIKIAGKLKETTLVLIAGSKDKELELVGCMVSPSDAAPNGIELFSHKEQKQWVFRVETSELRERWVEELQKAIDACPTEPACAPVEAEPEEPQQDQQQQQQQQEMPDIVIDPITTSDEEIASPLKNKRTSFSISPNRSAKSKPVSEIPEQGVQMKGYVHRKKGTFGGWERAYAVVTYAAIYFTSGEEVREYHHVCLLNGSGTVKLEKKGHDKTSEGLVVRSGRNKEMLSLPLSEVHSWRQVMEEVLGVSTNLELGSDEEDEGAESATPTNVPKIEDDQGLYEELPAGEEIDEDIYEEFDDVKPSSSPPEKTPPSLPPPRQEQRLPSPALPLRNDRSESVSSRPSPTLPQRNSPTPTPKLTPQLKKSPAPSPTDLGGDELYEDVVALPTSSGNGDIVEEMYDDVVAGGGGDEGVEELYEDVEGPVGGAKVADFPTEDYTEMDIGQGPTEDYVLMEKPQGDEEELEVYCEVDPTSPSQQLPPVSLPPRGVPKPAAAAASKIVKPPPPASYTPRHADSLSHKPPQKSKFYEEWCAVEGTNLCCYKNQKDKRVSDKLSLSEFDMAYSPAGKDGKVSFRLMKGDKVHHFTPGSKESLTTWISALRGLAKSATLELPSGEQEIYETTADHTAESDEQIGFKSGSYLRVISRGTSNYWIGQLGSTPHVFTGKIGKFPTSKVRLAEDLYI